jgi:hypothetical protein
MLLRSEHTRPFEVRCRTMQGWLRIDAVRNVERVD